MTIGLHEAERDVAGGDELFWRMERMREAYEISPTRRHAVRWRQATQALNDYNATMNKKYADRLVVDRTTEWV